MEELIKKIEELNILLKQVNPSIKTPKIPKPKMPAQQHEVPNAGTPTINKDPVKVAEQLKNPDNSKDINTLKNAKSNRGKLNINKLGQWQLNPTGKV